MAFNCEFEGNRLLHGLSIVIHYVDYGKWHFFWGGVYCTSLRALPHTLVRIYVLFRRCVLNMQKAVVHSSVTGRQVKASWF